MIASSGQFWYNYIFSKYILSAYCVPGTASLTVAALWKGQTRPRAHGVSVLVLIVDFFPCAPGSLVSE